MSPQPVAKDGSPLDRIVAAVRTWDTMGADGSPSLATRRRRRRSSSTRAVVEQAKGAVMLRYGVEPHVALGILACWARGLDIPFGKLAQAVVDGVTEEDSAAWPQRDPPARAGTGIRRSAGTAG
jgi:ANTAR domain